MRKRLIEEPETNIPSAASADWLDIEAVAAAELSSEDPQHPFEQALTPESRGGWRAAKPGPQQIRIRFDSPQTIRRVHLEFREAEISRSQEIALFATTYGERRELVRQQWQFSPHGSTTEVEDYSLDLRDVTTLELEIDPGRHDRQVFASLESIRIA